MKSYFTKIGAFLLCGVMLAAVGCHDYGEDIQQVNNKVDNLDKNSAVEVEEWGKRKLAYAIDYKTEGYYVLVNFTCAPEFPRELDRKLRIADGIMRSLIVCKGE